MDKAFDHLLLFGCFVLASYFTTIQFIKYSKDYDISLVSYRKLKFDSESKDQYPTYTVCIYGSGVYSIFGARSIFKQDSPVWTPNLITPKTYRDFLTGVFNYKGLKPTPNTTYTDIMQTFSEIKFEEVVIDFIKDILITFVSYNRRGNVIKYKECPYKNATCIKPLFLKSQQTPDQMCYSRKFYYDRDFALACDKLVLNASQLSELGVGLRIYVHPAGQLIRHMSVRTTEVSSLSRWGLGTLMNTNKKSLYHEITHKINEVAVLRKREKKTIKCNERLFKEDENWRFIVRKTQDTVGCLPAYWVNFVSNSTVKQNFTNCTPDQYQYINKQLHSKEFFTNISKMYTDPCTEMERAVHTKSTTTTKYDNYFFISLKFKYDSERYMEIKNIQAFNDETLLSQVGGLIGM